MSDECVKCDSCGVDTSPTGFCRVDNGRESVNVAVGTCGRCASEWDKAATVHKYEQTLRTIAGVIADHGDWADDTSDGELLDIVYEVLDEVGLVVGGLDFPTNFLRDLRRDAARWNALGLASGVGGRWCASCELVNDETEIDPMSCAVVPWSVMGDARAFAFVCDGCASGSAVVL